MQSGDVVALRFESGLVALSFLISVLGAYVSLLAATRIRTADNGASLGYVAVAAVALGGIGIWSMHFIGMVAQSIPFAVAYSLIQTLISLVVAILYSGAALWYVGSAFSFKRCLVAGFLAGIGVASMHYLGMASMRMDAMFEWQPGLIVLSVLIAIGAATAALWLAFNVYGEIQRICAAVMMALAVCGMHYTGVLAGTIVCTTPRVFSGPQLDGGILPYAVFLLSMVTLVVMRIELHRSSTDSKLKMARKLENMLNAR